MNLESRQWDQRCLDVFGIKRDALPRIVSNAEEYGRISSGPLQGIPICGCLGDQQAALLGALLSSRLSAQEHTWSECHGTISMLA